MMLKLLNFILLQARNSPCPRFFFFLKKEKNTFPTQARSLMSQTVLHNSIHSPSFSFFSWFSSAAVLSALKKILALLSEK